MVKLKSSANVWKLIFVASPLKNNISGKIGSLSLNGGTILPTILHLKWIHMKHFMVRHLQYSFHTPPTVYQFRKLTWFFKTKIRFFAFCMTIFTLQEIAWNSKSISTFLSAPFKSVIWFFFICSLITSNPPWHSKGIRIWLQNSTCHLNFFRKLGLLLINWNFLLLLAFT